MGLAKEADVERYAMDVLLENPSRSIDSVIKEVNRAYHSGIAKEKVVRLRRKVQELIGRGMGVEPERHRPEPEPEPPFNPPRLVAKQEEPKEEPMEAAVETTNEHPSSSPEERRKWFSDWALDNPGVTVETARRAISDRFGMAIGTKAIIEILGEARQIHADMANPKPADRRVDVVLARDMAKEGVAPTPTENPIRNLVELAKQLGIKKLEIHNDNTYTVELQGRMS